MSNKKNSNVSESDKKVEWLYSGNNIDRNAYLLGKPIDKRLIEKEIDTGMNFLILIKKNYLISVNI